MIQVQAWQVDFYSGKLYLGYSSGLGKFLSYTLIEGSTMWMYHGSASKYMLQLERFNFKQCPNRGGHFYKVIQCTVNAHSWRFQQHLTTT